MEIYVYGFQLSYMQLATVAAALFLHWIFLPVICELKMTSINEVSGNFLVKFLFLMFANEM